MRALSAIAAILTGQCGVTIETMGQRSGCAAGKGGILENAALRRKPAAKSIDAVLAHASGICVEIFLECCFADGEIVHDTTCPACLNRFTVEYLGISKRIEPQHFCNVIRQPQLKLFEYLVVDVNRYFIDQSE